ncbi:MAG: glycosyltransferase [Chlorobi bacterium]|nr:glycosyltransferase [Chlorobiota bacterium]MCI0716836.1 glycosyltransferase [Chlorobiota bacterium]
MSKSVLHIAPENTAGVPYNVVNMQNMFGMPSRLITFYKIPFSFPEDICLNLPIPRNKLAMKWRDLKLKKIQGEIKEKEADKWTYMPYFKPKNTVEKIYMIYREKRDEAKFLKVLEAVKADSFDIIHFDGGIDFFMDSRLAKKWKSEGKKIVNCYYGDDLRTRGIVKEMDELSDLNLTFEYDHTLRHQNINFLFFPFDNSDIDYINDDIYNSSKKLRVVHSPTHRFIKGTNEIINALEQAKKVRDFEFVLLENLPREKVIELKKTCHIAIDQIGNRGGTGYGINSLESLSMGIPTITDMNCGMDKWLPENPFIVANKDNLTEKLIKLIDSNDLRQKKRVEGRQWVDKYHSYISVFEKLMEYYKKAGII